MTKKSKKVANYGNNTKVLPCKHKEDGCNMNGEVADDAVAFTCWKCVIKYHWGVPGITALNDPTGARHQRDTAVTDEEFDDFVNASDVGLN